MTLAWLSMTPFGLPVDPDVYMIAARSRPIALSAKLSSGEISTNSDERQVRARRSSSPDAPSSSVKTTNSSESQAFNVGVSLASSDVLVISAVTLQSLMMWASWSVRLLRWPANLGQRLLSRESSVAKSSNSRCQPMQ